MIETFEEGFGFIGVYVISGLCIVELVDGMVKCIQHTNHVFWNTPAFEFLLVLDIFAKNDGFLRHMILLQDPSDRKQQKILKGNKQ